MSEDRQSPEGQKGGGKAVTKDGYVILGNEIEDDIAIPFRAESAGARGRVVRLGSVVNEILTGHDYPDGVCSFLGEAIVLTAMIGSSLKFDGKLILQTKTDGPISMLVVDYTTPGLLRAYASFDKAKVAALEGKDLVMSDWLGTGYLALTVDQGEEMERYQGIVPLESEGLGKAAEDYFEKSEQIPSLVRLHTAKHYRSDSGEDDHWQWRAGGLMVQYLTSEGGNPSDEATPFDDLQPFDEIDDDWHRARILGETVEAHELLDPELAPERLLFRLYHEEGVRVYDKIPLQASCTCSSGRVEAMLSNFSVTERNDMVEDEGKIRVTCEFCNRKYEFSEGDFAEK